MDTAPTGHTLLLLDTTGAYHRQTKIVLATTPEPTPVLEAEALHNALRRAGIEPFAWVINASLAAAQPRDPVLRARARAELEPIRTVRERLARRVAIVSFLSDEPIGSVRLAALADQGGQPGRSSGWMHSGSTSRGGETAAIPVASLVFLRVRVASAPPSPDSAHVLSGGDLCTGGSPSGGQTVSHGS